MEVTRSRERFHFTWKKKEMADSNGDFGLWSLQSLHFPIHGEEEEASYEGFRRHCFELIIDSAETIGIVSRDLKEFLNSDSDEIPNSVKQLAKMSKSIELTDSIARVFEAVLIGVFRGYNLEVWIELKR